MEVFLQNLQLLLIKGQREEDGSKLKVRHGPWLPDLVVGSAFPTALAGVVKVGGCGSDGKHQGGGGGSGGAIQGIAARGGIERVRSRK